MLLSFFGILSTLRVIVQSVYVKLCKAEKKLKFSKCTLGMKAFPKCVETLQRDRECLKIPVS